MIFNSNRGQHHMTGFILCLISLCASGCTVKAVGDPKRPITINAHITLDIRGLENTAQNIEDYVSNSDSQAELPTAKGGI